MHPLNHHHTDNITQIIRTESIESKLIGRCTLEANFFPMNQSISEL